MTGITDSILKEEVESLEAIFDSFLAHSTDDDSGVTNVVYTKDETKVSLFIKGMK